MAIILSRLQCVNDVLRRAFHNVSNNIYYFVPSMGDFDDCNKLILRGEKNW